MGADVHAGGKPSRRCIASRPSAGGRTSTCTWSRGARMFAGLSTRGAMRVCWRRPARSSASLAAEGLHERCTRRLAVVRGAVRRPFRDRAGHRPGYRRRDEPRHVLFRNLSERRTADCGPRRGTGESRLLRRSACSPRRTWFCVQFGDPQTRDLSTRSLWGSGSGRRERQAIGAAEITRRRLHVKGAVAMAHLWRPGQGGQPAIRDAGESPRPGRPICRVSARCWTAPASSSRCRLAT
jgi:hypothetical protein